MERTDLQTISTFSALLPIIVGSFVRRKKIHIIFFLLFLAYGFATDLMMFIYFRMEGSSDELHSLAVIKQNVYSLVDATFLFFFLGRISPIQSTRKLMYGFSMLMFPLWVLFYLLAKDAWLVSGTMSGWYDPGYEMLLSLCSAFILLQMIKPNSSTRPMELWLCIGIFLYNFSTFFVHAFIGDKIIEQIWYLTSVLNIITMVIYAYGFFTAIRNGTADNTEPDSLK